MITDPFGINRDGNGKEIGSPGDRDAWERKMTTETFEQMALRIARSMEQFLDFQLDDCGAIEYARRLIAEREKGQEPVAQEEPPFIEILKLFLCEVSLAFGHWERQWFEREGAQDEEKPEREPTSMLRSVDNFLEYATQALYTSPPAATLDAQRLDYLSTQYVTVRVPLRYGSRESFCGSPDLEETTWDLRAAIDAAMKGSK